MAIDNSHLDHEDIIETPTAPAVGESPEDSGVFRRIGDETVVKAMEVVSVGQEDITLLSREEALTMDIRIAHQEYSELLYINANKNERKIFLDSLSEEVRDGVFMLVANESNARIARRRR